MADEVPQIRPDGLQLSERRPLQRRVWMAQRVGWLVYAGVLLAALAGLTGAGGPLARAVADIPGGRIEYRAVERWAARSSMAVTFEDGETTRSLTLSPSFLRWFRVTEISPTPTAWFAAAGGSRMVFGIAGGGPATIVVHVQTLQAGRAEFAAAIDGNAPTALSVLVLP